MEKVKLKDPLTKRSVKLPSPDPSRVTLDVVHLEELAHRWCNLMTQQQAEAELYELGARHPLAMLHGLSWLIASKHAVCEARTGKSAYEGIKSMDYVGPWRRTDTPEDAKIWKTLNYISHQGAIAALTGDPKAFSIFEENATQYPELWKPILHHMLVMLDGFTQDMTELGLAPWGWAALLTGKTDSGDSGC